MDRKRLRLRLRGFPGVVTETAAHGKDWVMLTGTYAGLSPEAQAIARLVVGRATSLPQRLNQALNLGGRYESSSEWETPRQSPVPRDDVENCDRDLALAAQGLRILDIEVQVEQMAEQVQLYRAELVRALTYRAWDEHSWGNN